MPVPAGGAYSYSAPQTPLAVFKGGLLLRGGRGKREGRGRGRDREGEWEWRGK